MPEFLIMKGNKPYMPVEFTTPTGAVVKYFVNKEEFEKGEVTEAMTFEKLMQSEGIVYICKDEK